MVSPSHPVCLCVFYSTCKAVRECIGVSNLPTCTCMISSGIFLDSWSRFCNIPTIFLHGMLLEIFLLCTQKNNNHQYVLLFARHTYFADWFAIATCMRVVFYDEGVKMLLMKCTCSLWLHSNVILITVPFAKLLSWSQFYYLGRRFIGVRNNLHVQYVPIEIKVVLI